MSETAAKMEMPAVVSRMLTRDQLMGAEVEPRMVDAVVELCMDDNNEVGPKVVMIGAVASLVTKTGEGNQEVYPDADRQALGRVSSLLAVAMNRFALEKNVPVGTTSHPGCGGGAAQDIPADQLQGITEDMAKTRELEYWGHLAVSDTPQPLEKKLDVDACITRPESNHTHPAKNVVITVGGGITGAEKAALVKKYGDSFQVSADFLAQALVDGANMGDLKVVVTRQLAIAQAIADGVRDNSSPVIIYDAGDMPDQVEENLALVVGFLQ